MKLLPNDRLELSRWKILPAFRFDPAAIAGLSGLFLLETLFGLLRLCGIPFALKGRRRAPPVAGMTTTDFVYLGLIAATALVFYCHGFFSGVNRSRRIYEALLGAEDDFPTETAARSFDRQSGLSFPSSLERGSKIQGDFGNN
jgi:hypothetical protein